MILHSEHNQIANRIAVVRSQCLLKNTYLYASEFNFVILVSTFLERQYKERTITKIYQKTNMNQPKFSRP